MQFISNPRKALGTCTSVDIQSLGEAASAFETEISAIRSHIPVWFAPSTSSILVDQWIEQYKVVCAFKKKTEKTWASLWQLMLWIFIICCEKVIWFPPHPPALFQLGINNNSRQIIASEIGWQSGIREFGSAALQSSDPWLKGEALD